MQPGWVLRVPYFWGGTRVLSTNHWLKKSIWCMPHATTLVFAFLLAERRRCRYETLLQWREHLHRYSMLQTSATLHCPEVLVSNRKIWAAITLFPLTISRQPARTLVTNLLRAGKTGYTAEWKHFTRYVTERWRRCTCWVCYPINITWYKPQWITAIDMSRETSRPLWACSLSLTWSRCTLVTLAFMLCVVCLFMFINLCSQLSGVECSATISLW